MNRVDYDQVAPTYDERYRHGGPPGIAASLQRIVTGARRVLEVGCGTGHWLAEIAPRVGFVCGLDRSRGMLERAGASAAPVVQGDACALPVAASAFDAVICVNALHHFTAPCDFVREARRVLRPGGTLVVIGMDPSAGLDRWYLYDYFPGTRETDLRRYPSAAAISTWMEEAGFEPPQRRIAARIEGEVEMRQVYDDPILSKNGTSQLTLLSDADFAAGMARIGAAIAAAETRQEGVRFATDISLALLTATTPKG